MTFHSLKLFILISLLIGTPSATACSCVPQDLPDMIQNAKLVYFAKSISAKVVTGKSDSDWNYVEANLQVSRVFKGPLTASRVTIRTGFGGGDCGVPMMVAQNYLVLSDGSDNLSICSGTRLLDSFVNFERAHELEKKIQAALRGTTRASR